MPIQYQLASTPMPSDLPYLNYRDAEIGDGLGVIVDAAHVLGVAGDGIGIALPAAGAPAPYAFGVTMERVRSGHAGRVRTQGIAVCKADGTIAPGDRVTVSSAATKLGRVRAKAAGETQLGVAQSAAVDGDDVLVLVQPATNS